MIWLKSGNDCFLLLLLKLLATFSLNHIYSYSTIRRTPFVRWNSLFDFVLFFHNKCLHSTILGHTHIARFFLDSIGQSYFIRCIFGCLSFYFLQTRLQSLASREWLEVFICCTNIHEFLELGNIHILILEVDLN